MLRKVKLGEKYRDSVLGLEGVATARSEYLTGCDRVCLEFLSKSGSVDSHWVDITRLENVKILKKENKPGGPQLIDPGKN